jgi:hypothetical protein
MRTPGAVAALGLLLSGCAGVAGSGTEAACTAPSISVEPTTVPPGGTLSVRGTGFAAGCADSQGVGEDGTTTGREEPTPLRDLEVLWTQHGTEVTLAEVDADDAFGFTVEVDVPAMVEPGPAAVTVAPAEPVRVTVSPSWTEPPRERGGG